MTKFLTYEDRLEISAYEKNQVTAGGHITLADIEFHANSRTYVGRNVPINLLSTVNYAAGATISARNLLRRYVLLSLSHRMSAMGAVSITSVPLRK